MLYNTGYFMNATGWTFMCAPIDKSNSYAALGLASAAWWYYFSKFTEFFDTFFFILRKKFDNVSTLHVIHHGIMPLFAWEACRWEDTNYITKVKRLNN